MWVKQFLAILLLVPLVAAAACSSTGDPESELLQATSTPAEAGESQSPASPEAAPQAVPITAASTAALQVTPTLPADIPTLPVLLWPTMDDPSPTAEDALKDYLLHHPSETFGYQLVVGCQGLAAESNPNTLCSREPQISDRDNRQLYVYGVGRPPPEVTDYSIGIEGSASEGWWVLFADTIAR